MTGGISSGLAVGASARPAAQVATSRAAAEPTMADMSTTLASRRRGADRDGSGTRAEGREHARWRAHVRTCWRRTGAGATRRRAAVRAARMGYTHTWGGARKSAACATLASGHCQRASAGSIALERAWVESADGRDAPRLDMPRSSLRVATLSELLHLQRPAERADDALRSDSDSDGMDGMRTVPLLNRRTDDGGRIPQDPVRAVNSASRAAPTEVRPSDGSPSLAMLRRWQSYTSDSSSSEEEDGGKQHKASARVPASRARPPAAVTHPGGGATHPLPAAQHPVAGRQASKRQAKPAAHGKGDASLLASLDRALLEFLTATAADEVPVPVSGGKTWRDEAMPELPDTS